MYGVDEWVVESVHGIDDVHTTRWLFYFTDNSICVIIIIDKSKYTSRRWMLVPSSFSRETRFRELINMQIHIVFIIKNRPLVRERNKN